MCEGQKAGGRLGSPSWVGYERGKGEVIKTIGDRGADLPQVPLGSRPGEGGMPPLHLLNLQTYSGGLLMAPYY